MKPDEKLLRQLKRSVRGLGNPRRRRPFARRTALLLAPLALIGGAAIAKTVVKQPSGRLQPKNAAAARQIAAENQIFDLINKSDRRVYKARPSCSPQPPLEQSTVTHDRPEDQTLRLLAPLRRPATPAEKTNRVERGMALGSIYADYKRTVTAADGAKLTIIVSRGRSSIYRPTHACLEARQKSLEQLLKDEPEKLRHATLRRFASVRRNQARNNLIPKDTGDELSLFGEGGGGRMDIKSFKAMGLFGTSGTAGKSQLTGLVPDGVASITLIFPRVVPRGKLYKPARFPTGFEKTVPVKDNVVSVAIPRTAPNALPPKMIWRDSSGKAIKTVKGP